MLNVKFVFYVSVFFETGGIDVAVSRCLHYEREGWFIK